jgi:gamma-glutamyltranspeptidase
MESAGMIVLTTLPNHIQLQSLKFDVKVDFALQNHQTHFWVKNTHKL